ncbi:MATE family efflux transporter [bacterium]|nr:MATE family efflux transporter [bacterium]
MRKKKLLVSYFSGIVDVSHGENYSSLLRYFFPELVTNLVIYSLPFLIDSVFIAFLRSTSAYTTLTVTNTILHMLVKMGEGLAVGGLVLIGHYNGLKKFKEAGTVLVDLFWSVVVSAFVVSAILFFGAFWIYSAYRVPAEMIPMGVSFLRLRAIGMFFTFVYFALVGFLRGIKNTRVPMLIFMCGGTVLVLFDYLLIFGNCGFPKMGLNGSAVATLLQYSVMLIIGLCYIFFNNDTKKYGINLLRRVSSWKNVKSIFILAWPVMLDKIAFAGSYIWLGALIAPMGKYVLASYGLIKDMERFALMPAVAFAQIITFLVSNDYGRKDWDGIKTNVKKIVFLASAMVFLVLLVFSIWPEQIAMVFDQKGRFASFSAIVFPILSVLVFFDVLQLILSGAMRGAQQVKTVMWTRFFICFGCFFPLSYTISILPIENSITKFLLLYGSFYVVTGFMSIIYIYRFRGEKWKTPTV